jgi:chromosome partitioning protein
VRTIKQQDVDGRVVIVDLEGVSSRLVSRAISQADLALTRMRTTTLDATIGVRAFALIVEDAYSDVSPHLLNPPSVLI